MNPENKGGCVLLRFRGDQMRNTLLELAREYESGEEKGGCALLRFRCERIRNALLEFTIKNPEKK